MSYAQPGILLLCCLSGVALGAVLVACKLWLDRQKLAIELSFAQNEIARTAASEESLRDELSHYLKSTCLDALNQNSEHFLTLARESFDRFQSVSDERLSSSCANVTGELKGLSESLSALSERRALVDGELAKRIELLAAASSEISLETNRLRQSLSSSRGQGLWGEQQLRNLLKHAGMLEYADFDEQVHLVSENGSSRLRPDVVVRLPNNCHMVIDAKAPIGALFDLTTQEGNERKSKLSDFRESMKRHVRELGGKKYSSLLSNQSVSYTVLFLPSDALLPAVFECGEDIISFARNYKIIIATPSSLLILLAAASSLWRDQSLVDNAREIETLGKQMYDRLIKFTDSFRDIGTHLERGVRSYNTAVGSLESRVLVSARKFAALGVGASQKLDDVPKIEEAVREFSSDIDGCERRPI